MRAITNQTTLIRESGISFHLTHLQKRNMEILNFGLAIISHALFQ